MLSVTEISTYLIILLLIIIIIIILVVEAAVLACVLQWAVAALTLT